MIYGLDICAGSGIGSAAFEAIGLSRTVCYVERDTYCQRLIEQRMQDGWLSPAPIWDDLKTFDGRPWRGLVDFVFGGIPCQPHSLAGKRGGAADERDLWPDFWRVVREVGPRLVLVENVPGMLSSDGGAAMGRILGDLAEGGYDAEWDCIPAQAVGAPHRRDRVWVVAYARSDGRKACDRRGPLPDEDGDCQGSLRQPQQQPGLSDGGSLADTDGGRRACAGHNAGSDREGRRPGSDCPLGSESTLADASRGRQPTVWGPQGQAGQSDCSDETVADAVGAGPRGQGQHVQELRPPEPAQGTVTPQPADGSAAVADAQEQPLGAGLCAGEPTGKRGRRPGDGGGEGPAGWWELEPGLCGLANGVATRVG